MNCITPPPDWGGLQMAAIVVASCMGYAIVKITNALVRRWSVQGKKADGR